MRIAVIAASGKTGRATVRWALKAGHEVVAVVRSASSAPTGSTAAIADVRDVAALTSALTGVDAVVSCLGHVPSQEDPTLLTDGMTALVAAMGGAGVMRLVAVSAAGAFTAGDDPLSRFVAKPLLRNRFHAGDTRAMEAVVRASSLSWTLLRPSMFVKGSSGASYRVGADRAVWWHYTTRPDTVGRAAVDALATEAWVGRAVFITG